MPVLGEGRSKQLGTRVRTSALRLSAALPQTSGTTRGAAVTHFKAKVQCHTEVCGAKFTRWSTPKWKTYYKRQRVLETSISWYQTSAVGQVTGLVTLRAACWGHLMEISSIHAECDGCSSDRQRHVGLSRPSKRPLGAVPPASSPRKRCSRKSRAVSPPFELLWSITWGKKPCWSVHQVVHSDMRVFHWHRSNTKSSVTFHHSTGVSNKGIKCVFSLAQQHFLITAAPANS